MERSLKALTPSRAFSNPEEADAWLLNLITVAEELKPGQPVLSPLANEVLLDLYCEVCEQVGPAAFLEAYSEVMRNSRYRPDIAEIRKAAGCSFEIVSPLETEARGKLQAIIAKQRTNTWKLGARPVSEPGVPAPTFDDVTEAAILELGYGARLAGLEVISRHPALQPPTSSELEADSYKGKQAADVEREWFRAYAQAKREIGSGK
jgi:hypothetical protein